MAPQRDNMLEAFRKATSARSEPERAPEPVAPKPEPKRRREVAAPSSASAPSSRGGAGGRSVAKTLGGLRPPRQLSGVFLATLVVAVAFGAGVLVGRGSRVSAADPEIEAAAEEPAASGRSTGSAGLVPAPGRAAPPAIEPPVATEPRSPLLDPANEYTIAVVTYGASQEELAFAAYDHLAAEGLPVFDPYLVGDNIVLLVGAAPRSEDLAELERRVRGLSRNGTPNVYGDAYRIRIDRYVER